SMAVSRRFMLKKGSEHGMSGPPEAMAMSGGAGGHSMQPPKPADVGCSPTWAQPSADGRTVWVACNKSNDIVEIDVASWRLKRRIAREESIAGVPPQNRFVVAGRPLRLGLLVPAHRLAQPVIGLLSGSRGAQAEVRLGASLADDSAVIRLLVLIAEAGEQLPCPVHAPRRRLGELVGAGRPERHQRLLVAWIHSPHVQAAALRRGGVID